MKSPHLAAFVLAAALAPLGCAPPAPPKRPPGLPPTPATISRANPGGDADDPELAALRRLATEDWVAKQDRWKTLDVPLMDGHKWRRVTIWGHPTRASFRYGDDHLAVATVWYTPIEGPNDPETCLARFRSQALEAAQAFGVEVGASELFQSSQTVGDEERSVFIEVLDGKIDSILKSDSYVGAVAAYESWPGTCLVEGFAVVAGTHRDLALEIRERWLEEGAPQLLWRIDKRPSTEAR